MKNFSIIKFKKIGLALLGLLFLQSCQNDDADLKEIDTTTALNKSGDVFINTFSSGLDYAAFAGSDLLGFQVDNKVAYNGSAASMRFDVPNVGDPDGGFTGGTFFTTAGRDLSGYNVLTFWAKGLQACSIEIGFGLDNLGSQDYKASCVQKISTTWKKYYIPIPDASKLKFEKGLLYVSAGPKNGDGFTFWLDDVKYEKLETIEQFQPKIMNGVDVVQPSYIGSKITLTDLTQTFNLASGLTQTVITAPSYFTFVSSDNNIATVDELGVVSPVGIGTAIITASINNVVAIGSLKINVTSAFVNAPNPSLPQPNVISLFSDTYSGVTGFNPGFFAGPNTSNISTQIISNNQHLSFQSVDYVGLAWNGTVNLSSKTMLHVDIQLKNTTASNLRIELKDFGPDNIDNNFGAGNDSAGGFIVSDQLVQDNWVSIDIPLNAFTLPTGGGGSGLLNKNNIGFVIFVSSNGASFLVDNIYFY